MRVRIWGALVVVGVAGLAQEESDLRTRQLWNTKFSQKRPAVKAPPPKPPEAPGPAETPKAPAADDLADAFVGITVWRLRPSTPADDKEIRVRGCAGEKGELTPERVEADTVLGEGEKVRVGIETARAGFLYVIDREQYADGTYGAASLIFPTLRTRGGENRVSPGRLVEIPAWEDNPPCFTLRMSRADQASEMLTVLVTPQRLAGVKIGREPLRLTPDQVAAWEKRWGTKVKRLGARDQAGKPYTRAEKEAATEQTRALTHEEPLPQTLYHVEAKAGEPLLVSVPLRIAR